jgi:hypothetical protein
MFQKYGTHVIEGCELGGRLHMQLYLSQNSYSMLHDESTDISVSVKILFFAKASASFSST